MDYLPIIFPVLGFCKEVLFDDSSEEENEIVEKVDMFAEETVPQMTDKQFKLHFRMCPETFEDLLQKASSVDIIRIRSGNPKITLEKELMITIWYLGNIESFRCVANRFGVTKSTCWKILKRIGKLFLNVNGRYKIISWPNRERQIQIANDFRQNGFYGVIGCIDGSHIKIVAPKNHPNSYVNRKGYHSVLLQGVCDSRMLFTDAYAGEPGSIHDYTLYKKSELYAAIQQEQLNFFNDFHLIGDLAYKLSTNLLVGFKDNGHLTLRQKNFNIILSKVRVKIENAFALLKGRFRKLKFLETIRLDLVCLNIMSCCILHNICLLNGDSFEDIVDLEEEMRIAAYEQPENIELENYNNIHLAAVIKRQNIVNGLPIIRVNRVN